MFVMLGALTAGANPPIKESEKEVENSDDSIVPLLEGSNLTVIVEKCSPVPVVRERKNREPSWVKVIEDVAVKKHLQEMQKKYCLDDFTMEIVMKIFWTESRFKIRIADNYNSNGSIDTGPMQINSINWNWLAEEGFNVHDWRDNIEAGVYMYADLHSKYPLEQSIAFYQCGEYSGVYSTQYSRDILSYDLVSLMKVKQ